MRQAYLLLIWALLPVIVSCTKQPPAGKLEYDDFLKRLVSLDHLAELQVGRGGMLTSYDRTGGNQDGSYFTSKEPDGTPVLADLEGPGCITRFWLTGMPPETKFYFYFDGEKTPSMIKTYSEIGGNGDFPFVPMLSESPSGAGYSYLPITFAKRLKVTTDPVKPNQFFYFQINHSKLPPHIFVETSGTELFAQNEPHIRSALAALQSAMAEEISPVKHGKGAVQVGEGAIALLYEEQGPAVINELKITLRPPRNIKEIDKNLLLRALVLRIYWDGSGEPSVEVPFGDFFCNGVRGRSFRSLPVSVEKNTFVCRFPMPFASNCKIEIQNDSPWNVALSVETKSSKHEKLSDNHCYFHAFWNQSLKGGRPHEILGTKGKGHYAGCYLIAIGMDGNWNILEGDENIYIDRDIFPSFNGTGLEDYFNAGWYYNGGSFAAPFAGALERSGIRNTQYRFHVPDIAAFDEKIRVNIEFGHGNASRGYMSSVAYWYSQKIVELPKKIPPLGARIIPADPLEADSLFCELWERERLGLVDEAIALCDEYKEKYGDTEHAELMQLRKIAYREWTEGFEKVEGDLKEFVKKTTSGTAKDQVELLQKFNSDKKQTMIVAHINGPYRVFLDGAEILKGDDPLSASVAVLPLDEGRHELMCEVVWTRPDPWLSVFVRTHGTNFWTDGTWLRCEDPSSNIDEIREKNIWIPSPVGGPFPWMRWFRFQPNAFVFAQHRKQLLYEPERWIQNQKVWFKKEFEVPPLGVD